MITVILGGARSGKSELAERLAAASAERHGDGVTYIATMVVGDDADLAARVAAHRARRPATWATVDAGNDLPGVLRGAGGTVLLDSLGPWLAYQPDFRPDTAALCHALTGRTGDTIVVSDEVGLALHPVSESGSRFRDALGMLNQAVAAVADRSLLVVAGRVLTLSPPPEA